MSMPKDSHRQTVTDKTCCTCSRYYNAESDRGKLQRVILLASVLVRYIIFISSESVVHSATCITVSY